MFKKLVLFSISTVSQLAFAANAVDLYQAPLIRLINYSFIQNPAKPSDAHALVGSKPNQLQWINQTNAGPKIIVRYQQLYQGIPVVGAEIMITKENSSGLSATHVEPKVNGHLIDEIDLDTKASINPETAIDLD